jgi:hypothetical protein
VLQCLALRDTLRAEGLDDPAAFSAAWADATARISEPWYRDTLAFDRHRLAEIDADIRGESYRPAGDDWEIMQSLTFAAGSDPDCLRALLRIFGLLSPAGEVLAQPGLLDKVSAVGSAWREAPLFGPSRAELLSIVAA